VRLERLRPHILRVSRHAQTGAPASCSPHPVQKRKPPHAATLCNGASLRETTSALKAPSDLAAKNPARDTHANDTMPCAVRLLETIPPRTNLPAPVTLNA